MEKRTEKRTEKREQTRRRRKKFAGIMVFLLAVFSAVVILCVAVFFKVQTITVTGSIRYLEEDIVYISGIQLEQNILSIDTVYSAREIREEFPYVEAVEVVRVLPTTVEIRITESVPALVVVNSAQSYTLLSSTGRMIEQGYGTATEDLPLVVGADFSIFPAGSYGDETVEETLTTLRSLLEALEATGLEDINYIDVGDRLSTVVLYDNRVLVELGSERDMTTKLIRAKELLENQLAENFVGTLDLTVAGKAYTSVADVDSLMNEDYKESYFKFG